MGLLRADNTNFDNGVTNRNAADLFGSMAQLDPTRFHTLMDDFDRFQAADYLISGAGAGTVELVDGVGGRIGLTTAGADNDAENIQRASAGSLGAGFRFDVGAPTYFRSLFNVDNAVESDVVVGLESIVADPHVPAEGVVFVKADGGASLSINSVVGATVVATAVVLPSFTVGDVSVAFYWDGVDRVYYGVNGVPIGFLDVSGGNITTREVTPTFGVQAGQAAILVGELDYLFAASERG